VTRPPAGTTHDASGMSDPIAPLLQQIGAIASSIAIILGLLAPVLIWMKRRGKKRLVNWARVALTHRNGDAGLHQVLTVVENDIVAVKLHASIDSLSERLDVSEMKLTERQDLNDLRTERMQDSLDQLTSALIQSGIERENR